MDRIDEAVVIAMDARRRSYGRTTLGSKEAQDFEAMRAALLAGVKVLLGEPVVWQLIDTNGRPVFLPYLHKDEAESMVAFYQDDSQLRKQDQEVFTIRDLYAPSLGEGDGR